MYDTVVCKIKTTTQKAVCIEVDDEEHWIPLSLIDNINDIDEFSDEDQILLVEKWFIEKEGLW